MNQTLRIGLLYPLHSAEDDYPRMAETLKPPVEVYIAHTDSPNLHRIQESRITGSREYLMAGVDELRDRGVAVCMWACTSGSFAFGLEGARLQVEPITEELGVPASSTSLAFLNAAQTLDLQRVAVAATYPEGHAAHFQAFLNEGGIEVVKMGSLGMWTADDVALVEKEEVLDFAAANDHQDADAVLIPDTALHTAAFLADLEDHVGKTVLTANQVTMWEALRLAEYSTPQAAMGRLMMVL